MAIKGVSHGYFKCGRGFRQSDPISDLLFCLAEEVICRSLSKLIYEGKLKPLMESRSL